MAKQEFAPTFEAWHRVPGVRFQPENVRGMASEEERNAHGKTVWDTRINNSQNWPPGHPAAWDGAADDLKVIPGIFADSPWSGKLRPKLSM